MTDGKGGLYDKTINRIYEAYASIYILGYSKSNVICPDFPFYTRNDRMVSEFDYNTCTKLLQTYNPKHLFVCIDKDPNMTHHKCYDIIRNSILPESIQYVWLYKSAWEKWGEGNIQSNCFIPMNQETFERKLLSINMHISQNTPVVTDSKDKTFIERTKENNTSEMYPNKYEENFRVITVNEFKGLILS